MPCANDLEKQVRSLLAKRKVIAYVSGDAFSANPMTAAQDLAEDMPLIIGTMGHAMVLTSLQYTKDQRGNGQVNAAVVKDPWPGRDNLH